MAAWTVMAVAAATAAAIPAANKVSGVVVVIATDDTAMVVVVLELSQCLVSLGVAEVGKEGCPESCCILAQWRCCAVTLLRSARWIEDRR